MRALLYRAHDLERLAARVATRRATPREVASLAELLGYGPGESSHLLADYRRVTRRARAVVDRVFWGVG